MLSSIETNYDSVTSERSTQKRQSDDIDENTKRQKHLNEDDDSDENVDPSTSQSQDKSTSKESKKTLRKKKNIESGRVEKKEAKKYINRSSIWNHFTVSFFIVLFKSFV